MEKPLDAMLATVFIAFGLWSFITLKLLMSNLEFLLIMNNLKRNDCGNDFIFCEITFSVVHVNKGAFGS